MVMTMHINLSPEMESYIKAKVSSGFYGNATEVIRDAIRRMQTEEQRVTAFRKAVAEGEAQLDRGEGTAYSRDLMNKLADTARKNIGSGKPIDPDVVP
jgi:antitoxin ParD1/3/4